MLPQTPGDRGSGSRAIRVWQGPKQLYNIKRYQGVAGAKAQHIPSVRERSPGFVRSSKTFTTASVVVEVFFYPLFCNASSAGTNDGGT